MTPAGSVSTAGLYMPNANGEGAVAHLRSAALLVLPVAGSVAVRAEPASPSVMTAMRVLAGLPHVDGVRDDVVGQQSPRCGRPMGPSPITWATDLEAAPSAGYLNRRPITPAVNKSTPTTMSKA